MKLKQRGIIMKPYQMLWAKGEMGHRQTIAKSALRAEVGLTNSLENKICGYEYKIS